MKKSFIFSLAICLMLVSQLNAQKGGLLKKVGNSMANELLGRKEKPEPEPEPKCACDQPDVIMDMGGKYKIDYKEVNISVKDDGRILVQDRVSDKYYIVQGSATYGPFSKSDPKVTEFETVENVDNSGIDNFISRNKPYISKSGEKLLINFGGKTYGPYAQISSFTISKTKDKFAAVVIENLVANEADGKKMDEAIKKAKTDQEKMDLAMQYTAQMQEKMMQGGGPTSMLPKLVTNVPDATFNPSLTVGIMSGNIKYDDILITTYDKVIDLQGKTLLTIKPEVVAGGELYINTTNTKYAVYNYGTLTFSDKTTLSELFHPYLTKVDGKVYLAYMYYSPKKNSLMQCKIPF